MAGRRETSRRREVAPVSDTNDNDDMNVPLADFSRRAPHARRDEGGSSANPPQAPVLPTMPMSMHPDLIAAFTMMAQTMQAQQQAQQEQLHIQREQQRLQEEQQRRQEEQERRSRQTEDSVRIFYERLRKANMPNFEGAIDPEKAEKWLRELEKNFRVLEVTDGVKADLAISFLIGDAEKWWEGTAPAYTSANRLLTWDVFKKAFIDNYFPETLRLERQKEFFNLKQSEGMSVVQYAAKFNSLGRFVPEFMANEKLKLLRFREGLLGRIQGKMSAVRSQRYEEVYETAISVEADIKRADLARDRKRSRPSGTHGQSSKSSARGSHPEKKRLFPNKAPIGNLPKPCETCNRVHPGECRWKTGACFKCGKLGHKIGECPSLAPAISKPMEQRRQKPNARVFAMTNEDAENASDVVTGIILVNSLLARVLFDCGASHSFVSRRFAKALGVKTVRLDNPYCVSIPSGKVLISEFVLKDCLIGIDNVELSADLVLISMRDFDVILGMDWLSNNYAIVDC